MCEIFDKNADAESKPQQETTQIARRKFRESQLRTEHKEYAQTIKIS